MEPPSLILVPATPLKSQGPGIPHSSTNNSIHASTTTMNGKHGRETLPRLPNPYESPPTILNGINGTSEGSGTAVPRNAIFSLSNAVDSELAYYQSDFRPKPRMNGSSTPPRPSSSRPISSYVPPAPQSDYSENLIRRASTGYSQRSSTITTSRSVPTVSPSEDSHYSTSSYRTPRNSTSSRRNSSYRKSEVIEQDLPPLPPSQPGSIPGSRRQTPSPSRTPPPSQAPDFLSAPSSHLQPSPPSSSLPLKHPPFQGSPSSKSSLVPSEGEDLDGFHVRATYAQLDQSGVKGDGFDDGVERTRAKIGPSRASQLNAIDAIGDGTEKSKDLSQRELEHLAQVDRYGFFSIPSHDRLVLLPTAPLLKRLSKVSAGSSKAPTGARSLDRIPPSAPPTKESSRISKWTSMLKPQLRDEGGNVQTWNVKPSLQAKFRERTYKGIPDRWRPAAWEHMMGRLSRVDQAGLQRLGETYRDCLDKASTFDIQIDLDVPRTISGHIMFHTRYGQGQRSLFHVLHSFSLRCPECGYVQGMGPIAATLLCYFDPERVYASLVRLHDEYMMHTIFSPGFPGLLEAIYVQERITQMMMPDVYNAFKKHMISTTSYATKWYITLYSNSVPFQTQLRLWDAFLLEGQDVFIAMSVALVWVYRDQITSASANFETVLSLLSSFFVPEDEDALLSWISKTLGDKKLRANMNQWRKDWRTLVATGKEGTALL